MNIEMESMPNNENEWIAEGVMRIEMHNDVQQGIETGNFHRMVTLNKSVKPESKLEIEAVTYNAYGRGHKDPFNFIRCINKFSVKLNPKCACIGGVFFIIAVILLPFGITQDPSEERHNENRQELLNNMTDESCYLQNVTQQSDCTYSCNCRQESCRRRRLRGAKGAKGGGGCSRRVCDECQGVQFDYSGFATSKCGTDQLMYFSDNCNLPQRLLQEPFTCFVTNCSSQIAAFEPIDLPNEKWDAVIMIFFGSIFACLCCFCFNCALCFK